MKGLGIIGGSGLYQLEGAKLIKEHNVKTPFGSPSSPIWECDVSGIICFFLARHGVGHIFTPSEVNYRANIYGLKSLGVDVILSISAVGSLREDVHPGMVFLPDQFLDWTKGVRKRTFFGEGIVGHVSAAYAVDKNLQTRIFDSCKAVNVDVKKDGTYVCIEGPQFSSRAESEIYRSFKASIIGMTNVPEAYLAKEAGMSYATMAMVTDYDCWKDDPCSVEEIMKVVRSNHGTAHKVLKNLVPSLGKEPIEVIKENQFAVMTNPELLTSEQKELLLVLQS